MQSWRRRSSILRRPKALQGSHYTLLLGKDLIYLLQRLSLEPNGADGHPLWRHPLDLGAYRGVETATSMLFELMPEYGSPVARVDLGTQESCIGDAMVYPGLGHFGPYVPKIGGLQQSVKEEDLVGGLARC